MADLIERMRAAMNACNVDPALIEKAVQSAQTADLFAAPVVPKMSAREADAFFVTQFWPNYPKRDGQNPKEPTRKLIVAALISGENPEAILAGVRRLGQDLARRNKIGTEFVPMAKTWARGKGWKDDPTDPMPPPSRPQGQVGFYAAAAMIGRDEANDEQHRPFRPT